MFKNPKYLPCLHTFCKLCIHTYIQSSVAKENIKKGFKCPVCRTLVSVGKRSNNPEGWADKLPNNHLIMSMIDRQAIKKLEKICNVCELSNVNQKAVSWCTVCQEALCSTCENCHRKFKMSSHHKIMALQEVLTDKTTSVSRLITCEDHSEKFAEIFCLDHGKPCCTVCATVKHWRCDKVLVIEKAAAGIKEAKQTTEFLELIMLWKKLLDKSIQDTQKHVCSVDIMEHSIFSEIEKLKKDIIEHVNKVEKVAKEELVLKKKGIVTELADIMTEMFSLKSTVNNWHNILSTSINNGSEIQCLVEFNKLVSKKEKLESEIVNATSNIDTLSLTFQRNRVAEKFQENVTSLGKLSIENSKQRTKSESLRSCSIDSVSRTNETNCRTGKVKILFTLDVGENSCNAVSGMFIEDFIFITNNKTKKLLKFGQTGIFQCDIEFDNGPFDITNFRGVEIAVSVPNSRQIHLINIHTMAIGRKIQLTLPVYGLKYFNVNDQFVAACKNSILLLNASNGKKIKETKTSGGQNFCICAYKRNSYVYADGWDSVSCSEDDSIKFTYKSQKLSTPRGIDADFRGNLYICSYSLNSIHQISTSGKLIKIITCEDLGTMDPWVIRFKQNSNKFLVTSLSSGKVVVAEIT
ncbi:unnamed protein product [Mytilus coruscus]|uniref:TRIM56 n=1 Tax=Mytilus coruscus TaxID=42192 RepID=A0A6J8A144_MYTCO|nr:unnamed protein product [Mytilus coruscus]